ncbi:MAG: TM1266 family iron-only hydrogenase system putative regulator [Clostridia bacterium]
MKRIGVIGIVVTGNSDIAIEIQNILSEFSDIIIGRMGIPIRENNIKAISIIVKGSNEKINALTGKLGRIDKVNIKSALTSTIIDEQ